MKDLHKLAILTGSVMGLFSMASSHAVPFSNTTPVVVNGVSGTSTIEILAVPAGKSSTILDLNVTIDFMKCSDAGSPFPSSPLLTCPDNVDAFADEIIFTLSKVSGPTVSLVGGSATYVAGAGGSFVSVTFDDEAASAITVAGTSPATGSFLPEGGFLSDFDPLGALGVWELYIEDLNGGDPLGVFGFTLDITLADAAPAQAPVPATALLLGLGLAGLAAGRRRRG